MVVDAILVLLYIYLLVKVCFINVPNDPNVVSKLQKYSM